MPATSLQRFTISSIGLSGDNSVSFSAEICRLFYYFTCNLFAFSPLRFIPLHPASSRNISETPIKYLAADQNGFRRARPNPTPGAFPEILVFPCSPCLNRPARDDCGAIAFKVAPCYDFPDGAPVRNESRPCRKRAGRFMQKNAERAAPAASACISPSFIDTLRQGSKEIRYPVTHPVCLEVLMK
jgi:hypothetical protein